MLEKELRECRADLRSGCRENIAAREWWGRFIDAKRTTSQAASGLFALPNASAISVDASFRFLAPSSWGPDEPTAAERVRLQGHNALHRRTVNSPFGAA